MIDTLDAEAFGPLGSALQVIDTGNAAAPFRAARLASDTQAIVLGVDRSGSPPEIEPAAFDALLTTAPAPPRPWVHVPAGRLDRRLATIAAAVAAAPVAACMALRVLRIGERLPFADALHVESTAYSTLLGGDAFRRWRAAHPAAPAPACTGPFVEMSREDDRLIVRLARPDRRNAMTAGMRDALFEALAAALDDPTAPAVELRGAGRCFSTGGDLPEFGTAADLAAAHAIRTARSGAALLHRLGERATVRLHGACIGSGIEVAAAAARRIGEANACFQLPELGMGLMPGAGGTVTLPRAIGRHRTAYMILSGRRIDAATARGWGLLTAMAPA